LAALIKVPAGPGGILLSQQALTPP
jgi:hypothetical protein